MGNVERLQGYSGGAGEGKLTNLGGVMNSMVGGMDIIRETGESGIKILRLDTGYYYVVWVSRETGQVSSIGPDNPPKSSGGTNWVARLSPAGVRYVSSPRSRREAASLFNRLVD